MPLTFGMLLKSAAAAGIAFVGGNTSNKLGATSGNTTIALNSGLTGGSRSSVQAGDLVIAVFASASTTDRTLAITDGTSAYTLIGSELFSNNSFDTNLRVAYKFMGGTPDTSTTFGPTNNAADAGAMAVYVFSGVNQTTTLDVAAVSATGTGVDADPASITPITSGAFIVVVGAGAHGKGAASYSAPSGVVDFLTTGGNDTNDIILGIAHKDDWTSGAFNCGQMTGSVGEGTGSWAAMSIALRPA